MKISTLIFGSLSAVMGTAILLYVSLTTGLGPWLAPMLVLLAGMVLRFVSTTRGKNRQTDIVLIQTIGSVGSSVATAVGFSLPTLYFLQPKLFNYWLAFPFFFSTLIGVLTFAAGWYGIAVSRMFSPQLQVNSSLSFPVSTVIYETIQSQAQRAHALLLSYGFGGSWLLGLLRDGWRGFTAVLPRRIQLFPATFQSQLSFQLMPVYWAVGFLAGWPIVLPLLVGMVSKYVVVYPLNNHAAYLSFSFFSPMATTDFVFAFCSGIVLSGTVLSLFKYPKALLKKVFSGGSTSGMATSLLHDISAWWDAVRPHPIAVNPDGTMAAEGEEQGVPKNFGKHFYALFCRLELVLAAAVSILFLTYISFPFLGQGLLLLFTMIATYQLMLFAGRTGLATYGRFMTFAMVPLMLLFSLDNVHITFLCVFVGVAAAAGVDLLFGYQVGKMTGVSNARIHRAQLLGLVVTALSIGVIMWLLCTHFELGSADLIAYRGRSRALLLNSYTLNWWGLALGAAYAQLLSKFKINPTLAFGGLIMANEITLGLALGAALRSSVRDPEHYTPFWSGVFAGDSLWILISLLGRL
ncbi:MAG: OPT/YSL family transporter [Candidatus Dependentiae bacterium]